MGGETKNENCMDNDHDLLVRIDERTQTLHGTIGDLKNNLGGYVTKKEFAPVRMVVYGLVTLILTATVVALTKLILK